jgi:DNA helicase IV
VAPHPDLEAEQAHIDRTYDRLEAMREHTREILRSALSQSGGSTPQAREEREVLVTSSLGRLAQLDIGDRSLCFGRIDRDSPDTGGETFYVGRLGVYGENQEPLTVDWRAPVAEPFYRATGRDPMGLTLRRHFATEGRRLLDIEDELFGSPNGSRSGTAQAAQDGGDNRAGQSRLLVDGGETVSGSGMLLAELERSRSGHMRDIVATVQKEQDEVIRAPLPGVLLVQGGPGTGKTSVALHRAAYLLYTHRFPLERQGVLVLGPNQVFLRYIERVLPSLGESGVAMSTIEGLVRDVEVRGHDTAPAALLKGDAKMAQLLAKAVADRERPLKQTVEIPYGSTVLRLTRRDSEAAVAAARRRPGTHNSKRRFVEAFVTRRLRSQHLMALRRAGGTEGAPEASSGPELDEAEFAREIRRFPALSVALDRMWPRLLPEELLHDLFGSRPLLSLAGRGLLARDELGLLYRKRSGSLEEIPWTRSDLPLLDEARLLLGPARGPAEDDWPRRYGHIVVDEAQDLSPMELRMLARRCLSGSMTVVGDIAQATGPRAPDSWEEVTRHLPQVRPPRIVELSVNYRTPAEVMDVAAKVLAAAAPWLCLPRPVRSTGERPRFLEVAPGRLQRSVAEAAAAELERAGDGTVAVVTPLSSEAAIYRALREAGLPVSVADDSGIGSPLTVVPVTLVKGLEFDSVVVAEPSTLVEEAGPRALFVALSRPTKRLAVVHSRPLPTGLKA